MLAHYKKNSIAYFVDLLVELSSENNNHQKGIVTYSCLGPGGGTFGLNLGKDVNIFVFVPLLLMKVKNDHLNKFSNLSTRKEKA